MGIPVTQPDPAFSKLSHQEVSRIIEEIEKAYALMGVEWLPSEPIAQLLCRELGYEDIEEFKDAIGGSFTDLLNTLPDVQTQRDEEGNVRFRVEPEPEQKDWVPRTLIVNVTERSQLWNVLLKSPYGALEVPEMEFAIQRNGVKRVDSLYNHIGNAIFELGAHVRTVPLSRDHNDKIVDCIGSLNELLDVPLPWTCVVLDPSGISRFADMSNVEIEPGIRVFEYDVVDTEEVEVEQGEDTQEPAVESGED
ncbi:hypothetical protein PhCBS80983_g04676 [Powellomyces hirtus]|uniref:Uncharacterized protein n=1 Tax=Powellomyces hirtus TaxID=109895 RepID=A0A507DWX5_9FUNG|nr:hypothetical protein PhCBS80983_g04676 [Powellomyces hirtus]